MKNFKPALSLLLLLTIALSARSQPKKDLRYSELGLTVGTLNYSGNITEEGNSTTMFKEMGPRFGIFLKRNYKSWFSIGIEASYGWFSASDENHNMAERGFEVTTSLYQINPVLEFNLVRFGKYKLRRKISPYARLGGGVLFYSPDPSESRPYPPGYDVYPLSYITGNIFVGGGFKFRTSYKTVLTLTADFHNSFVDNLDGFQEKEVLTPADRYWSVSMSFSYCMF